MTAGAAAAAANGLTRATLKRAPIFIARAEPTFFAVTAALETRHSRAADSAATREDPAATGMDPVAIVGKVSAALSSLDVVASTVIDFSAVADGWAQFLAEGRKAAAEKAASLAADAAKKVTADMIKKKAAAKRQAASLAARGGSGAPSVGPAGSALDAVRLKTSAARAVSPIALGVSTSGHDKSLTTSRSFGLSSSGGMGGTVMMSGAPLAHSAPGIYGATTNVTAEARAIAAQLTRGGSKVYFSAKTPAPPTNVEAAVTKRK